MATKINSEWWTIPDSPNVFAYSNTYLSTNFDKFDFENLSSMDKSIVPWGMGYSAAAAVSWIHNEKTGTIWSRNGKLIKQDPVALLTTNNPMTIWNGWQNPYNSSPWYIDIPGFRWTGAYNVTGNYVYSLADWDTVTTSHGSTDMPPCNQKFRDFRPVVYLDYQNFMLFLNNFIIVNRRTHDRVEINATNFSTWEPPTGTTWDEWELVRINYQPKIRSSNTWQIVDSGSSHGPGGGGYFHILSLNEYETPEDLKGIFFGENSPQKTALFQRYQSTIGAENDSDNYILTDAIPTSSAWNTTATYNLYRYFNGCAGRFVPLTQLFSDVSYKQKFAFLTYGGNDIRIGDNLPTGSSTSDRIYPFMYYEIQGYDGESSKMDMWEKIALHEIAFFGFPIFNTLHAASSENAHIGDTWVYLPDFDYDHMITNGGFFKGADAIGKNNAEWGDIFDDDMPEWDSSYFPPPPGGGGDGGEDDGGQLDNSTYRNIRLGGSNYFYALSESELHTFINFVNGMYINDADDTNLKLDFKGSNPNDYIVGVYAYPFNIPNTTHTSNVYIGPVETTVNANVVKQVDTGYFSFGSLTIEPYYNDFRDYAPYTQIELYIPLCGTVDLDAAFYMGHTVTVDGVYDINTGALTIRVLRDSEIDRTFDGSIAVQIPVTARNMGDYQNNIHQLRMNLINASISGVTTVEKTLTGGISQAAQSYGANNPMSAMSVSSLDMIETGFAAGQNIANAKYNLTHIQPKIAMTSTASTSNAIQMYNKAIMFIKRAKMLPEFDSDSYAHTVGYACCMNKYIGDMSGLTVATNIDISGLTNDGFSPTAEECEMIKQAFSKGVYI